MQKKGWIALDIDGTITVDRHAIPTQVVSFLKELASSGWQIVFATGRTFKFASIPLAPLNFPFYFLPQNGSVVLKMPEKTVIEKRYLNREDLAFAEKACKGLSSDPLIYGGVELDDCCFFRPTHFSDKDQAYLDELQSREGEIWKPIASFDDCPTETFPLLKYFGTTVEMKQIALKLENHFHVTQIRDPFVPGIDILLVTHLEASKGQALSLLLQKMGREGLVIAAGDDSNDLSLFAVADFKIAMPHAPSALLDQADLIAEPTSEFGIINALKKATAL